MRLLGFASTLVFLSCVLLASPAAAAGACHKINARAQGQDLGAGVTRADIRGGGLLQGTTVGNFAITGASGAEASISGTVDITTNQATVTVTVAGTFNTSSGAFSAAGPVTASNGKLGGSTGSLAFVGVENLSDGSFVEDVSGTLCTG